MSRFSIPIEDTHANKALRLLTNEDIETMSDPKSWPEQGAALHHAVEVSHERGRVLLVFRTAHIEEILRERRRRGLPEPPPEDHAALNRRRQMEYRRHCAETVARRQRIGEERGRVLEERLAILRALASSGAVTSIDDGVVEWIKELSDELSGVTEGD
jgi:hypothetical protein